jgi:plasmid stability protein
MVFNVKITLNIDDTVMQRLREEAARQGKSMSELLEAGLRGILASAPKEPVQLPQLPAMDSGGLRVDVADRNRLYELPGSVRRDS